MISIVTLISTSKNKIGQLVSKVFRLGRDDVRQAINAAPHGVDSNPVKDMVAVYADGSVKGQQVIIGYLNKNAVAEVGGLRLYSTNTNGVEQIAIYFRANGTIEVGGDSDFMVRYSALETAFNELQTKFNTFANAYVPGSPTTVGLPPTVAPSTADISLAKINEIKTL
jgi:hypothetical protein